MTTKSNNVRAISSAKRAKPVPQKGDAAKADDRHATERCLILDGIDQAESLLGEALIEGLRMTVKLGRTSSEEVAAHYTRCNNPAVYASWFNLGDRAQAVVGQKLALDAIERAISAGKGSQFQRAREALLAVCNTAKTAGVKELSGRAARNAVKSAVQASVSAAGKRTAKKSTPRGTKAQDGKTLEAAAAMCGKGHKEMANYVLLASQQAHKLPAPEGREQAHKDALAALAEAAEAWAIFAK